MIYTNLFKPNRAAKTKTAVYYMIESRKYKLNIIFDKKFTSIISAVVIGAVMFSVINTGIFIVVTTINNNRISSLEAENNNYLSSLSTLEAQQSEYLKQKANADNIYNISDKPTKWSSIIESIAAQLPYDTVLTSVKTTISDTTEDANNSTTSQNTSITNNATSEESSDLSTPTDGTIDDTANNSNSSVQTPNLEEQILNNEDMVEHDTIVITGKSLSMVNLSLFLDKLDMLDIFSKVECSNAEKGEDSDYYDFTIYAYLN